MQAAQPPGWLLRGFETLAVARSSTTGRALAARPPRGARCSPPGGEVCGPSPCPRRLGQVVHPLSESVGGLCACPHHGFVASRSTCVRRRPGRPGPARTCARGVDGGRQAGGHEPRPDRACGAASVRGQGAGRRRAHGAGGRGDGARGRGPHRGAAGPARPGVGGALPGVGDASARAAEPAQRHGRPAAGRAAADQAPRRRGEQRAAQGRSSRPSARCCSRRSRGWPTSSRSSWPAGRRSSSRTSSSRLAGAAYSRVDLVEKRGEFAVRGGIVDVFPPTEEHPLRVEFFGDEIDEIRAFAVADQRTLEPVERVWAPPCRELLLTDDVRRRAAELGKAHPQLVEITDKLAQGMAVEGMESLSPALVEEMELLVELLPPESHVLVLDPERVRTRAHDLVATSEEFLGASWAAAASGGTAPIDLGAASLRGIGEVRTQVLEQGQAWWGISPFGLDMPMRTPTLAGQVGGRSRRRGLPRRHRGRGHRRPRPPRGRPARGHHPPGPRAGAADGRGARRARRARAAGGRRVVSTARPASPTASSW